MPCASNRSNNLSTMPNVHSCRGLGVPSADCRGGTTAIRGKTPGGTRSQSPGHPLHRPDPANSPCNPFHCGGHRDARIEPVSRCGSRLAVRRVARADDWGTPGRPRAASQREPRRGRTDRCFDECAKTLRADAFDYEEAARRVVQPVLGPTKEGTMGPFAVAAATSTMFPK